MFVQRKLTPSFIW